MVHHFMISLTFLFVTFTIYVDAMCAQGQVIAQTTKYGTVDIQCVFNNMKVLPGSTFKLPFPDCLECTCTAKSMTCCGFGFNAGIAIPPAGCIAHNDACKLIFVKENNQGEVCKSTKSATPILECYECGCDQTNVTACNCGEVTSSNDGDYCVLFEQKYTDATYIQLSRIPRNSTWIYIRDPYYILTQESIRYNATSDEVTLWTSNVVFGCDWDRCNSPNLIGSLPESFKLSVDKTWLKTNIYGTGSVSGCNHCPKETCGNTTNPIDFSECNVTSCDDNITTCFAYDLWNNIDTGEQCFQSQCAPEYLNGPAGDMLGGKYRIDAEIIVYLAQNRSKYDIWELDVYCGAENCSQPTIFQEVVAQFSLQIGDLSVYPPVRPTTTQAPSTTQGSTTTTPLPNPLRCYHCDCFNIDPCICNSTIVSSLDYTYCIIVVENLGVDKYIYADYLDFDATYMYISEFPYALVEESIDFNKTTGKWFTTTNFVVYGCNWNLCNKPELIPLLPNSFQMRLPDEWLNSSILGSGQPARNCHQCPDEPQCGTTEFLEANTCPIQPCNTTCLVLDTYDDPEYDYLCYQSFCLPQDNEDYQFDANKIEIEGIVYASQPNVVQLWEVDIYCRADDCSRPGIFKELHEQLTVQSGTLTALFNETHDPNIPQRRCYDCYCYNKPDCPCERTTTMNANETYCLIMREVYGNDVWISMGHLDRDSTRVYIREFPYLIVEESILYDEKLIRWNTTTNFVVYGCNEDYCNDPRYIQYLPDSFQMRLPDTWLNTNVLGSGAPARDCHECPDAPQCGSLDFLDDSRCAIKSCNTTCLVFDTFDDPADDLQCYQSFCAPPDSEDYEIDKHRVEIEGILYLRKQPREVEIWEIDLYCRADDCSRKEIFQELKDQLTTVIGNLGPLDPLASTTTIGSTGGPGQTTTTTGSTGGPGQTTTTTTQSTGGPGQTTTTTTTTRSTGGPGQTTTAKASSITSLTLFNLLLISILLFSFH